MKYFLILLFLIYSSLFAQEASHFLPELYDVDAYLNSYQPPIPIPKNEESLVMDVRWGSTEINNLYKKAYLQVAFATAGFSKLTELPPINVGLVIDKSGSMKDDLKLVKMKKALIQFVEKLRIDDYISLIVYDTEAYVLLSARKVGNKEQIKKAIYSIQADGNTNLNGGMVMGFEEVMKYYAPSRSNRLILLTDGIANVGEINPANIIQNALKFNEKGISLSTVGIGKDVQIDVLKILARKGNGKSYFVDKIDEIETVFQHEIQSLLCPLAKNIVLSIETPKSIIIREVLSQKAVYDKTKTTINLPDFSSNQTKILFIALEKDQGLFKETQIPLTISLAFYDIKKKKNIIINQTATLLFKPKGKAEVLMESLVKKNYALILMAKAMQQAAVFYNEKEPKSANSSLLAAEKEINMLIPKIEDADILRILTEMKKMKEND